MPFTNSKTKTTKSAPPLATIAIATAPPLSTSLVTPPVTSHDCGSQYPLIDQFITDQLVKDGMTGRIREWTYFSQGIIKHHTELLILCLKYNIIVLFR